MNNYLFLLHVYRGVYAMIIIGLCGNSGSGKSTVCKIFSKYGIPSIDADMVYRELTTPNAKLTKKLSERFGKEILNDDRSLNRRELSKIVFSDNSEELLKELNKITHSSVIEETKKRIAALAEKGEKAVIFDAPLLFESGFDKECDLIVSVCAEKEEKIARIIKRDNVTMELALKRIESQLSEDFLKANSDFVINTGAEHHDAEIQIKEIIKNIFNSEVQNHE